MKITYAKNSLRAALDAAPAQMAQTALVKAEDMLTQISSDCMDRIDALIAEFPANGGGDVADVTRHIYEAYETGRKMIGLGTIANLPEMDVVARSLCDVADGLMMRGHSDWEPLRVHVGVMHLLRRTEMPPQARQQLLAGLETVRARFITASAPGEMIPEVPAAS